ncbi:unnamed protein product [Fraxinus pennsylvanica]|uniref:Uncharacterized protein n=1 Tax=Fraxinus pennsylvanica TaxID=56036 RepID=A0AAD1ZEV4_9LAMI|nr:unnamed protein product [Fraxinus pennsylvanica]
MVRRYKVTGQKRKKREKYDREEEFEQLDYNNIPQSPKKAKTEGSDLNEEKAKQVIDEMSGIPIVPTYTDKKPGVIFILERASLEIGKVGKVCMIAWGRIWKFVVLY